MKHVIVAQARPTPPLAFLGLDVAKDKVDACLLTLAGRSVEDCFANSREGHRQILAWLERHAAGMVAHVGLESTGPYSRGWCELLHAAGHAVSLLNPARPK